MSSRYSQRELSGSCGVCDLLEALTPDGNTDEDTRPAICRACGKHINVSDFFSFRNSGLGFDGVLCKKCGKPLKGHWDSCPSCRTPSHVTSDGTTSRSLASPAPARKVMNSKVPGLIKECKAILKQDESEAMRSKLKDKLDMLEDAYRAERQAP